MFPTEFLNEPALPNAEIRATLIGERGIKYGWEANMCQLFAGQDPADYEGVTRSVRLNGLSTSLRLEARYWRLVDEMAADGDLSTPKFLSTLHDEVLELHGEVRNFASLLRTACLVYMEKKAASESLAVA